MNLLAAGAAFGVVTAVFQDGFLAEPLGVGTGPVEAFLPVMMLAILFGCAHHRRPQLVAPAPARPRAATRCRRGRRELAEALDRRAGALISACGRRARSP
jgi:hypothetical protein